jgi:hypothetical protein
MEYTATVFLFLRRMSMFTKEQFDEKIDLAQRAVACGSWRWMPGMLAGTFSDWYRACDQKERLYWQGETNGGWTVDVGEDWVPNLIDAATLGCLLELVRDAANDPWVSPYVRERADKSESEWTEEVWGERFSAPTEEGVLVEILEWFSAKKTPDE